MSQNEKGWFDRLTTSYDEYRDEFSKSNDIGTIRFSNIDILQNLSHVLKKIEERLKKIL